MNLEKTTLGNLTTNGKGEYGVSASAEPFSSSKYTYLRITDINDDGTINKSDLKSVSVDNPKKYLLKENDIVFARTGASTGRNYFYNSKDGNFIYAGFLIKFSLDCTKVNPRFIKYFCLSQEYKDWIASYNTGSTRGNINAKTLSNMPIALPPKEYQDKCVEILTSIDDKISLNNKINKNLEEQAQSILTTYFINFSRFGGEVPNNWKQGTLQDIVEFSNGYAFKSKELLDAPSHNCFNVFKQGHINRGGGFNSGGTKSWYPKEKCTTLSKYILHKGDVLMAMTDMKDNVAILGNTALMTVDDQYIANQRVGILRSNGYKNTSYAYIYLLTNSFEFLRDLRSRANSGVQVNLSSNEIINSPVWIATEDVNKEFNSLAEPLLSLIMANDSENQRLSDLRETLLPQLISGELDVSDVNII